jgi:excisionase family DNA binding protein
VPDPLLLTPPQAAKLLAISPRTLWGLSQPRGPVPTVKIGRLVRYSREALEAFVRSRESAVAPNPVG